MPEAYYTHTTSTVVDQPLEQVWAVIRDILKFGAIVIGDAAQDLKWHDGGSPERVPASFTFRLMGGEEVLHEELTGRSEFDHTIQYRARVQVLSMAEYRAEIRIQPVTLPAGRTFITYERVFSLVPGADPAAEVPMLTGIMDNEMVALRDYFSRG